MTRLLCTGTHIAVLGGRQLAYLEHGSDREATVGDDFEKAWMKK
jgi:hypothetical protein